MPKKKLNFIPNEKDNLHCFQACFKMVINYYFDKEISMSSAELLTNFVTGRPTWPYKGMLMFAEKGLYIRVVEDFPIELFTEDPEEAIKNNVGDDDIAQQIICSSDLVSEQFLAKKCIENPNIQFDKKEPSFEDIIRLIELGCLIIVNVNYWALLGEDKYYGHFVIVQEIKKDSVILQNPGLPPIKDQVVPIETFIRAWHYPNSKLANAIAVSNKPIFG